jgi:hypothetical protein
MACCGSNSAKYRREVLPFQVFRVKVMMDDFEFIYVLGVDCHGLSFPLEIFVP